MERNGRRDGNVQRDSRGSNVLAFTKRIVPVCSRRRLHGSPAIVHVVVDANLKLSVSFRLEQVVEPGDARVCVLMVNREGVQEYASGGCGVNLLMA